MIDLEIVYHRGEKFETMAEKSKPLREMGCAGRESPAVNG
jgi:hypothetical protein